MTPLISIIIPTYNRVQYVTRAIDAIRSQAFTAWELIVVDDGSSDGTADVLPAIAVQDGRIRYVRQANFRSLCCTQYRYGRYASRE